METVVANTAIIALMALVCYPVYYLVGLGFSRGFHRGKEEHIAAMLNNFKEESSGGAR